MNNTNPAIRRVSAEDACRMSLFDSEENLRQQYEQDTVERILRIRQMYNWIIANPEAPDKVFVSEHLNRFKLSKVTAYSDLKIVKAVTPELSQQSREFHLWRYNEMILDTYKRAKARNDVRTMERAASSYAKFNRVDLEQEQKLPLDMIVVQPFVPTSDPSVLGLEPIPNLKEKVAALLKKYRAESADIDDVEYEEADINFSNLFPMNDDGNNQHI